MRTEKNPLIALKRSISLYEAFIAAISNMLLPHSGKRGSTEFDHYENLFRYEIYLGYLGGGEYPYGVNILFAVGDHRSAHTLTIDLLFSFGVDDFAKITLTCVDLADKRKWHVDCYAPSNPQQGSEYEELLRRFNIKREGRVMTRREAFKLLRAHIDLLRRTYSANLQSSPA